MTNDLLRAYAYYFWPRLGWTTVLGTALLLTALLVQSVLVPELQAKAIEAKQALQISQVASPPSAAEIALERQALWLSALPSPRDALNSVDSIHAAALRHGVRLAHGEYRWVQEPAPKFLKYQMVFPVQGRYAAIQAWLADVMNANPTLALDGWNVARDELTTEELDGTIRLTLYTGVR